MSHFSTLQCKMQNLDILVDALSTFGFSPETHEEPQHLYGYAGDRRQETAHVIVRKEQISDSSNDLGFIRDPETGNYGIIISDYDVSSGQCGYQKGLGKNFVKELKGRYATKLVEQQAAKMGATIQDIETTSEGKIKIKLMAEAGSAATSSKVQSSISSSL